jgi:uncharacterized protein YjbJ (UPF0337 family)
MNINEDIIKGKWLEIKGEIQKTWGQLTSDEVEKTKGDIKSIAGLVQQKYGKESGNFQEKFDQIISGLKDKKDSVAENIKQELKS